MAQLDVKTLDQSAREGVVRLLSPLMSPVDTPLLRLSAGVAHVFVEAVRAAASKKAEREVVSSTTVFLAAYLIALRLSDPSLIVTKGSARVLDADLIRLRTWGRALRRRGTDDALLAIAREFFSTLPEPEPTLFGPLSFTVAATLSSGMSRSLASFGGRDLNLPSLLRRLVSDRSSGIAKRLRDGEITDVLSGLPSTSIARGTTSPIITRDAHPEELTLDVRNYAIALATVLRLAVGEFTFALYGRWGSGKTTLTNILEPMMRHPDEYAAQVIVTDESFAARRYAVARHNAWKYRAPPEAWIYAYKSLADAAAADLEPFERVMLAIRRTILRRGAWPTTVGLLGLVVLLTPLELKLQLTTLIASIAGFSAVLHLVSVGASATQRVKELFAEHVQLGGHEDKLGMLALIGEDVRALLLAWVKPAEGAGVVPWIRLGLPIAMAVLAGIVWTAGLLGFFSEQRTSLLPRLIPAEWLAWFDAPSGATFGDWVLLLLWVILAGALLIVPWLPIGKRSKRPDRVLLIVDDLDRCHPDDMLNVIEGLKLLLDLPEVATRLQILMLVDEDVLRHAITRRYDLLIKERAAVLKGQSGETASAIVAEQTEKLFASFLRIPQMRAEQLASLISRLDGQELAEMVDDQGDATRQPDGEKRSQSASPSRGRDGVSPVNVGAGSPPESDKSDADVSSQKLPENEPSQLKASKVRFTPDDVLVMQARIPDYFDRIGRIPSPRAIRMLTFKVQLCRFLLEQREGSEGWNVERVMDVLIDAQEDFTEQEDEAVTVARQVI